MTIPIVKQILLISIFRYVLKTMENMHADVRVYKPDRVYSSCEDLASCYALNQMSCCSEFVIFFFNIDFSRIGLIFRTH